MRGCWRRRALFYRSSSSSKRRSTCPNVGPHCGPLRRVTCVSHLFFTKSRFHLTFHYWLSSTPTSSGSLCDEVKCQYDVELETCAVHEYCCDLRRLFQKAMTPSSMFYLQYRGTDLLLGNVSHLSYFISHAPQYLSTNEWYRLLAVGSTSSQPRSACNRMANFTSGRGFVSRPTKGTSHLCYNRSSQDR